MPGQTVRRVGVPVLGDEAPDGAFDVVYADGETGLVDGMCRPYPRANGGEREAVLHHHPVATAICRPSSWAMVRM